MNVCIMKYLHIKVDNFPKLDSCKNRFRTIDSFKVDECWVNFRFRKGDLHMIQELLKLPNKMVIDSWGHYMSGEEVMLRGLYELASGENQSTMSSNVFGGGQPLQSKAFNAFVSHVFDNFQHLLHDNFKWFQDNGYLDESAKAIDKKMREVDGFNPPDSWFNNVCCFIDCNCLPTSCVGGGPSEDGANSLRWSAKIQEAFYNGWKSIHGLKHQSVDIAHGISIDLSESYSLRRNDLYLLRKTDVNNKMRALTSLYIFGDSAYKTQSNISSYLSKEALPEVFAKWNYAMKSVRISIEWNYGYTASIFRYVADTAKLRVLGSDQTSKVYTVVTLLRNMKVFRYGGQSSVYFGLRFREDAFRCYMTQTNFN